MKNDKDSWQLRLAEMQRHLRPLTLQTTDAEKLFWLKYAEQLRFDETAFVVETLTPRVLYGKNMARMGKFDSDDWQATDIVQYFHPEQRELLLPLIMRIQVELLTYRKEISDRHFHLRWMRAFQDKNGGYYYTCYTITPFQFDKCGYLRTYIGRIQWLKPFVGEPIYGEFLYSGPSNSKSRIALARLQGTFKHTVERTFSDYFKFGDRRLIALRLLQQKKSREESARTMGIKVSTVKDHWDAIRNTVKKQFPSSSINSAADAARFLKLMGYTPGTP